jgi:acetyl-CoA C-acetyltransferase
VCSRLGAAARRLEGIVHDESVPIAPGSDDEFQMNGAAQIRIQLERSANVYPMFEQAAGIAGEEASDAHRRRIGELWSQFAAVARDNPHAWSRDPVSADQIWRPGPANRMISWPYTKLMNSNNMVD